MCHLQCVTDNARGSSPFFPWLIGEMTRMYQVCRTVLYIWALITLPASSRWRLIRLHLFPLLYLLIRVTICACLDLWHTTQPAGTVNRFVHVVESKEISICRSANLLFLPAAVSLLHFWCIFAGFVFLHLCLQTWVRFSPIECQGNIKRYTGF